MESWRRVFRLGFAPLISDAGLEALAAALRADDPRLIQGATCSPPPLSCVQDWPVTAADPLGLTGWLGDGLETVGEVEDYFARLCYLADQAVNEPAACRYFMNWWDSNPRDVVFPALLSEVDAAVASRAGTPQAVRV